MVLLTNPDDELGVSGDEASTAKGPVAGDTSGEEVRVDGHVLEHDVSLDVIVVLLLVNEVFVVGGEHTPIGADGTVDISPSARFCISEAEIVTALYNGIKLLKEEEDKLAK